MASIQTLSYHAFLVEMEWLFELLNDHVERIGWQVASHQLGVPRLPRRVGTDVVPYYLAGDVKSVFEFARGVREVSEDFVEDTIDTVLGLIFTAPADALRGRRSKPRIDWSLIADRPLGLILMAGRGRARIVAGEWPALEEVQALTGLSRSRIERADVELREEDGVTVCEPSAVARLLERVDKDDDVSL